MAIRFDDEETELLRRQAEKEKRSMADVLRLALREHVRRDRHVDDVLALARQVAIEDRDILDRLAE